MIFQLFKTSKISSTEEAVADPVAGPLEQGNSRRDTDQESRK